MYPKTFKYFESLNPVNEVIIYNYQFIIINYNEGRLFIMTRCMGSTKPDITFIIVHIYIFIHNITIDIYVNSADDD